MYCVWSAEVCRSLYSRSGQAESVNKRCGHQLGWRLAPCQKGWGDMHGLQLLSSVCLSGQTGSTENCHLQAKLYQLANNAFNKWAGGGCHAKNSEVQFFLFVVTTVVPRDFYYIELSLLTQKYHCSQDAVIAFQFLCPYNEMFNMRRVHISRE